MDAHKSDRAVTPSAATEDRDGRSQRFQLAVAGGGDSMTMRREHAWLRRAQEVEAAMRGGQPLTGAMVSWVKNQRRANLCAFQIARLNDLPGWQWEPREDAWQQRLTRLMAFRANHGRSPRIRSADPSERALALWHARQRRGLRERVLPYTRAIAMQAYREAATSLDRDTNNLGV